MDLNPNLNTTNQNKSFPKVIGVIFVCLIGISVFLFAFNLEKFSSITSFLHEWNDVRHPYEIESSGDINSSIDKLIKQNEPVSVCDKVEMQNGIEESFAFGEDGLRNICIYRFAFAKKDASICFLANGKTYTPESYVDSCISKLARDLNDKTMCGQIPQEPSRSQCLYDLVDWSNDVTICKEIKDTYYRDSCDRLK